MFKKIKNMKIKVNFFERNLRSRYLNLVAFISTVASFGLIFVDIQGKEKWIGLIFLFVLMGVYITLWYKANTLEEVTLKINNSVIEIKVADIFEEEGYKVIAFNEYFDTTTDHEIISKESLNGQYIENKLYIKTGSINSIEDLDSKIEESTFLSNKKLEVNSKRNNGKKQKYKLGSIFKLENYLLTAMTKFDNENRAYLLQIDFINFLFEFWDNIDTVYNGNTIVLPVFGSGMTRFKENIGISDQELLNIIIWSFKISKTKLTYPSKLKIVIYEKKKDKINFYQLKQLETI
ncbi:macro domain-containing protein [Psychrilyobacter atlanticus]|uniref:macro domain-containing protein n=1 Tax=Psychrilyobacter atlanticus TaxID=271091 RepID=UPI000426295D|nr:macro domain-containing protein [Psychrilyobacter atlanticus]